LNRRDFVTLSLSVLAFPLCAEDASPLIDWIRSGKSVKGLRRLLDGGADPAAVDADGDTALHVAAAAKGLAYLEALLDGGVDPNLRNARNGASALVAALMAERSGHVRHLLARGADPGLTDRTGNTPLHVAAQINDPAMALILLEAGAPATARNAQGATFQPYLFMTPDRLLNAKTLAARRAVVDWLADYGIALEG
jgi:uncharacterized protein